MMIYLASTLFDIQIKIFNREHQDAPFQTFDPFDKAIDPNTHSMELFQSGPLNAGHFDMIINDTYYNAMFLD